MKGVELAGAIPGLGPVFTDVACHCEPANTPLFGCSLFALFTRPEDCPIPRPARVEARLGVQ